MNVNNKTTLFRKLFSFKSLIVIAVLFGAGYFGYKQLFSKNTSQIQYTTAKTEKGTIVSSVTASGQVSTANNTPVVTQVTGAVTKLYVKNGDKVYRGQPLMTIELDQSSQQKYTQQLASYQNAVNNLKSAKIQEQTLKSNMVVADNNFLKQVLNKGKDSDDPLYKQLKATKETADEQYKNQENVINQAQTSLNSAAMNLQQVSPTIYAPISGTISGISLQVGSVIPAQAVSSNTNTISQNIAIITTSAYPIITVDLTEIDIPNVSIGNKATVTFDAFPNKTFTGKVFAINTSGSVSSGVTTYPTTIILDTENASIYPNMSSTASIIFNSKDNVLMVPASAVQSDSNGQSTVRILENGTPKTVNVETGLSSDISIEIISGLSEGQEVVTSEKTNVTSSSTTRSVFSTNRGFGVGGGPRD